MRTCTKCDISKRENHFYKRKNGLSYMCKDCYSAWRSGHYTKHKDTYVKQREKTKGTIKSRYQRLKSKCKIKCITLEITENEYEYLINSPCFYCENKLGTKVIDGIGLDRLYPSLGYTTTNCVSCCGFCNSIKGDLLSPEEMKEIAQLLILKRDTSAPININQLREVNISERNKNTLQETDVNYIENKCLDCKKTISTLAARCKSCTLKIANPKKKLNDFQILEIENSLLTTKELMVQFGVSKSTINKIKFKKKQANIT